MKLRICPAALSGLLRPPLSKSMQHRHLFALFLASAAERMTQDGAGFDMDLEAELLQRFQAYLGVRLSGTGSLDCWEEGLSDDVRATARMLLDLAAGRSELDCGESASSLRFLLPVAAVLGCEITATGRGRLPERTIEVYQPLFEAHGATLTFPEGSGLWLPARLMGRLRGGDFVLPGDISSQFLTGLLLALPLAAEPSRVFLSSPLQSAPYVVLTCRIMEEFGLSFANNMNLSFEQMVAEGQPLFRILPRQRYTMPPNLPLAEVDASQAAFFHLANFLGQRIDIQGLQARTLQGDAVFTDWLRRLSERREETRQEGLTIDVAQAPDLVPALALAMAATVGRHQIINAGRLRLKESDRLKTTVAMLRALGIETAERETGLEILGRNAPRGYMEREGREPLPIWFSAASAETGHDHRFAMALGIAGCQSDGGVLIDDSSCVKKSYPAFFKDLQKLGARLEGAGRGDDLILRH